MIKLFLELKELDGQGQGCAEVSYLWCSAPEGLGAELSHMVNTCQTQTRA